MFAQGEEAFGMVEFFVGGLAGIDVGVPEFKEAIKHPGEFGCWGAGEQKSSISKQSERKYGIFRYLQYYADIHRFTSVHANRVPYKRPHGSEICLFDQILTFRSPYTEFLFACSPTPNTDKQVFLEGSSEGRFGIFGHTAEIRPILLHSNLLIVSSRDTAQPLKVLTPALALSARNSHRRHR